MTFKQTLVTVVIVATAFTGINFAYGKYQQQHTSTSNSAASSLFSRTDYKENIPGTPMVDFEKAATRAAPAVVHIRTLIKARENTRTQGMDDDLLRQFFGQGNGSGQNQESMPQQRASGSGVIISADGYIVTNNHVVDNTENLTVTLNDKKDYTAKLIGTDPSSDLAVIKIDAHDLPHLSFTNSDNVHLGQWVLAIGYPLDLETTVTSGIVSAKSRNIGINSRNSKNPIESFIQTDAVVNPGNSGGALVNTDGDVIGINSAIASPTGSYAGYSYAIPSNVVEKVSSDIIKYGSNQRAYLGIMFPSDQMAEADREKNNIKEGNGVFVMDVANGSAAAEAGIQKGDFITQLNAATVNTGTELSEKISTLRPGDKINITYMHNSDLKTVTAILKGSTGNYAGVKEEALNQLGASFEDLDQDKAAELNIPSGVIVKSLSQGILTDQTKIREGFIITKVNDQKIASADALKEALKNAGNSAVISGIYPDNPQREYQYALNDLNAGE